MTLNSEEQQQIHARLIKLVQLHENTRLWYWRTGLASLFAAAICIVGFVLLPDQAEFWPTVAIIVVTMVMWSLFLVAFRLQRKLDRILTEVKQVEKLLL